MTPRKTTKGTKQLGVEVTAELVDRLRTFCAARGETVRHHVEMALTRHMDNPPPPPKPIEVPPLPPAPAPKADGPQTTAKRRKAKP